MIKMILYDAIVLFLSCVQNKAKKNNIIVSELPLRRH